jgi:hypothetical protein
MCSNVPYTFDRRHRPAFKLTCVCSSAAPYLTHTLLHACVRMYPVCLSAAPTLRTHPQHECDQTHLRTFDRMRFQLSRDLVLGHCSSSSPHFTVRRTPLFPIFLLLSITPKPPPLPNTTITSPHHFPSPPCRNSSVADPFSPIFSHSIPSHRNLETPQNPNFSSIFFIILGHNSIHGLCPLFVWLILCVFVGVGLIWEGVFKPFVLGVHTSYSTKSPNEPLACLEGKVRLLDPLGPEP